MRDWATGQAEDDSSGPGGESGVSTRSTEPVRQFLQAGDGQTLSALIWGVGEPAVVCLHGRGQNASTWSGVARNLGVTLVGIDLPGHGHSAWRTDHDYSPWLNADAVAPLIERLAPKAEVVVGMSLGGTTTIRLAAAYGPLVRRAVVIDTTPSGRDGLPPLTAAQRGAVALLNGPLSYDSFDEMLAATATVVPGRSLDSLRRGVENNSRQREDGRWIWRYDREQPGPESPRRDRAELWEDVSAIRAPLMLVIAGRSGRVETEHVDEMRRRRPGVRVEVVQDAGHSVQSDQPVVLSALIRDFVESTALPTDAPH